MITMTLQQAEKFVDNCPNAKWDGWDIWLITEDPSAFSNKKGVFLNGKWHRREVIAAKEGMYRVSNNYGRFLTKAGR